MSVSVDDIKRAALARAAEHREAAVSDAVNFTMVSEPTEKVVKFIGFMFGHGVYIDQDMPPEAVRFLFERLNGR